jgi:integrase
MCGFISSFQKFRKKLEAKGDVSPGLTFHGLRHTVATVLAEAGVEAETIAAWLGQRSTAMAMHYSREANRHSQVRAVLGKFNPLGASPTDE